MKRTRFPQFVTGLVVCLSPQIVPVVADNLFVGDYTADNIYQFDTAIGSSSQTTFVYTGSGSHPGGFASDNSGVFYAAINASSFGNGHVDSFPGGVQTPFAVGLDTPSGVVFDSTGNMKVASAQNNAIYNITPGGVISTFATLPTGSSYIYGLAYDTSGILYAANGLSSGSVTEFNPNGTINKTFATGLNTPFAVAFDSSGNVYVDSAGDGKVWKFNPDGTGKTQFAGAMLTPTGMAFDSHGNLYVAEAGAGKIDMITPGGIKTTFASGLGSPWFVGFEPVPEPSTWVLLGFGVGMVTLGLRKNRS
jgi:streptogramin lyase